MGRLAREIRNGEALRTAARDSDAEARELMGAYARAAIELRENAGQGRGGPGHTAIIDALRNIDLICKDPTADLILTDSLTTAAFDGCVLDEAGKAQCEAPMGGAARLGNARASQVQ